MVTAKLICVSVFEYAKCWFSHDAAHFLLTVKAHDSAQINFQGPERENTFLIILLTFNSNK